MGVANDWHTEHQTRNENFRRGSHMLKTNYSKTNGKAAGNGNGDHVLEPIRGDRGASILGPRNAALERENPDMLASPYTDAGTIPNLKFSFSTARNRLATGGWARGGSGRARPDVLAKNSGVPESAFNSLQKDLEHGGWIMAGNVPGPLAADAIKSPAGAVPVSYSYRLLKQKPIKVAGGQVRIVDSTNFPAATTIAAALVEVEPGGLRELHWHPNTDEWQYYISGQGRMTVFASSGKARTFDYQAGDVGYVPFAMGHYVQNTGTEPLRFLEMFRSPYFADISLNQWMALTSVELVQAHLNLSPQMKAALRKDKLVIVASDDNGH